MTPSANSGCNTDLETYLANARARRALSDTCYGTVTRLIRANGRFRFKYPNITLERFSELVATGELLTAYQIGPKRFAELQRLFNHGDVLYSDVSQIMAWGDGQQAETREVL